MADNTILPGTGETYASDDRGGVKVQKVLVNAFDGPSCDAFGRWRMSQPTTIFDSKLLGADNAPLFWDEQLNSGTMATTTPTANKPYIDFTSSNTTAGKRTRQTFRRFNYQPGKSQLILMTGVLELASGVKTGCTRRLGLFDDNNGALFESNAGTINVELRSKDSGSVVKNTVAQASWNLDNLDGDDDAANPSGITADWTKAQIFVIDFQWLSVGRVRMGIEISGTIIYVHQFLHDNISAIPWASTPNLPLRYEIETTGSSGICSMRCICSAVISEGGTDNIGIVRHKGTAGVEVTTDTQDLLYALVGLKLRSSHLGATIEILSIAVQIQTISEYIEWLLLWNPTVNGTFTYANITNSALQGVVGITANTNTITAGANEGTHIGGGYAQTGSNAAGGSSTVAEVETSLHLGATASGTPDQIVLAFRPIGGTSIMDVEGSITWRETF